MVWSNWQGAIWRGAMLVLLFWSGLAWTQTSAPRPVIDPAERIMVVHENGKSTRCRVMETWKLPDGRVAHLLQALENGEKITIVDEAGPTPESIQNPRAMPKRIFAWGQGRQDPPEGSPLPPHMRIDSGIVVKKDDLPPIDAKPIPGPVIVNRAQYGGPITIVQQGQPIKIQQAPLLNRLFSKRESAMEKPIDPQVMDFREPNKASTGLSIVNEKPLPAVVIPPKGLPNADLPVASLPLTSTPIENPNLGPNLPQPKSVATLPAASITKYEIVKAEPVKKGWYPGANIQAWMQSKPTPSISKTEVVKTTAPKWEAPKADVAKSDDAKNTKKADQLLMDQSKVAEKQLQEKIDKQYGSPFSTAKAPQPEIKKPDPSPLAIPSGMAKDDKPLTLPPPPPKVEGVKTVAMPAAEKRDMWGNVTASPLPSPGKTLVDPSAQKTELVKLPAPPLTKTNDPLLSPERLIVNDEKLKQKVAHLPLPGALRPAETTIVLPNAPESRPGPMIGQPVNWPLGTQSVQAAHSGVLGAPIYVPVPTVTVPAPNNPPTPPAPQVPDAPQLNAYVNAFSPPPTPKGAQLLQPHPMQGMMPPQGMQNPNPMMTQQQLMMYQQMLAQQQIMTQQQIMMQYGYRPSPAMMYPYMAQQSALAQAAPSTGPTANFSRQYAGPQAPNPFAANPTVQTGYAPIPYPTTMPMQAMMPQPSTLQPVSYQQPSMPAQQQSVTQQVDQLIKSMRELPYPAQRELAAQSLMSFEWRSCPQIVPALLQSASQDPAPSVRAGCVSCLGRMNAAVEPVFGVLQAMRNDIDPRVRQEVEQSLVRLGQTPQ